MLEDLRLNRLSIASTLSEFTGIDGELRRTEEELIRLAKKRDGLSSRRRESASQVFGALIHQTFARPLGQVVRYDGGELGTVFPPRLAAHIRRDPVFLVEYAAFYLSLEKLNLSDTEREVLLQVALVRIETKMEQLRILHQSFRGEHGARCVRDALWCLDLWDGLSCFMQRGREQRYDIYQDSRFHLIETLIRHLYPKAPLELLALFQRDQLELETQVRKRRERKEFAERIKRLGARGVKISTILNSFSPNVGDHVLLAAISS